MIKIMKNFYIIFLIFHSCYYINRKNDFFNNLEISENYKQDFSKVILTRNFNVLIESKNNEENLVLRLKEVSKVLKRASSNENSQFTFEYDPYYENVEIIKAVVIKSNDYKEIKVTPNDVFEIEINNSNEQFSFAKRRKVINFPQLEEGDITEVEIKVFKKAFTGSNSLDIFPLSSFPILNLKINIKAPDNINYRTSGVFDNEFSLENEGRLINLKLKKQNLKALTNDRYENLNNLFRISTYNKNFIEGLNKYLNSKILINDNLKNFVNSSIKTSKDNLKDLKTFLVFLNNQLNDLDYRSRNLKNLYLPTTEEILKENKVNWISKLILLAAFCKIKNIKHTWAFDLGNKFEENIIKNISAESIKRILLKLNIDEKEYIFGRLDKDTPFGYNFAEGDLIAYIDFEKLNFKIIDYKNINEKFIKYCINLKKETNEVRVLEELKYRGKFAWLANKTYEVNNIKEIIESREQIKLNNLKNIHIKKGDIFEFKASFNTFNLANSQSNLFILNLKEYDKFISDLELKNKEFISGFDSDINLDVTYNIDYPEDWTVEFVSNPLEEDNKLFYIKRDIKKDKGNLIIEDKLTYKSAKVKEEEYNKIVERYKKIILNNKNLIIFKK